MNTQSNVEAINQTQFNIQLAGNELTLFRGVLACAAKQDVRYYLNGFHINNTYIEATDGHRAGRFKHGLTLPENTSVILPLFKIPASIDNVKLDVILPEKTATLAITDRRLSTTTQILSHIDARFPDVGRIVPATNNHESLPSVMINPLLIADVMKAMKAKTGVDIIVPDVTGAAFKVVIRNHESLELVVMGLRE